MLTDRYYSYSDYLRNQFGVKVYKLPVSLPVTCPNRDGTCGSDGCVFCGEIGAGYENLPASVTVAQQIETNMAHIKPKYKAEKFIAYFQNFSNTYLPVEKLRSHLIEACRPDVVGIALATRPDCIHEEYLTMLAEVAAAHQVDISIEMGLQTVNYHTLEKVNRGHGLAEFIDAVQRIKKYGFSICAHMILNLPWDNDLDAIEGARILSALGVEQVKLHALYIVKGTALADWYEQGRVELISMENYMERVILFLEHLHQDIAVQRLIGRAPASNTLFTNWQTGWWKIRDGIIAEMVERDTWQGKKCTYLHGPAVRKFLQETV